MDVGTQTSDSIPVFPGADGQQSGKLEEEEEEAVEQSGDMVHTRSVSFADQVCPSIPNEPTIVSAFTQTEPLALVDAGTCMHPQAVGPHTQSASLPPILEDKSTQTASLRDVLTSGSSCGGCLMSSLDISCHHRRVLAATKDELETVRE